MAKIDAFLKVNVILPVDQQTALLYGKVKAALRAIGRLIPDNDMWIAALARQHGFVVVTRDAHSGFVAGLPTLSW